jgi:hypothetical protein
MYDNVKFCNVRQYFIFEFCEWSENSLDGKASHGNFPKKGNTQARISESMCLIRDRNGLLFLVTSPLLLSGLHTNSHMPTNCI